MPRPLACRLVGSLVGPGLILALTGLAALPAGARPVARQDAPLTPAAATAPRVVPGLQPAAAAAPAPRAAPRPLARPIAADPPGTESLWFVGVFQ